MYVVSNLTENAHNKNIDAPEQYCYWLHFEPGFAKIYTRSSLANVGNKCSNCDNNHNFRVISSESLGQAGKRKLGRQTGGRADG